MPTILFSETDPRQYVVQLDGDIFAFHIASRHPEIDADHIRLTISSPDIITEDANSPVRENYYCRGAIRKWPQMYVKVCVEFAVATGEVIKAFATDRPKATEVVVWPLVNE